MNVPAVSTKSGRRVALLNPSPSQIVIGDIAHGLAHQCRFNGQTSKFYSVAQHSVLVASILPRELRLAGLLHDASETYLGDVVQPLKELLPKALSKSPTLPKILSNKLLFLASLSVFLVIVYALLAGSF